LRGDRGQGARRLGWIGGRCSSRLLMPAERHAPCTGGGRR